MSGNGGASNPTSICYSNFGSIHAHKLVLGFSLAGLAFALIGAPIWQFFSAGFSFNVWVLLEFTLIVAALILVLVGNWREKPYLYLPVLVFMFIALIYAASVVYRSYLQVTKDVVMFQNTVGSSQKMILNHEAAKIAVQYLEGSLTVHLAFVALPLLLYTMNILLTDYFFMLDVAAKPFLPWL